MDKTDYVVKLSRDEKVDPSKSLKNKPTYCYIAKTKDREREAKEKAEKADEIVEKKGGGCGVVDFIKKTNDNIREKIKTLLVPVSVDYDVRKFPDIMNLNSEDCNFEDSDCSSYFMIHPQPGTYSTTCWCGVEDPHIHRDFYITHVYYLKVTQDRCNCQCCYDNDCGTHYWTSGMFDHSFRCECPYPNRARNYRSYSIASDFTREEQEERKKNNDNSDRFRNGVRYFKDKKRNEQVQEEIEKAKEQASSYIYYFTDKPPVFAWW